VDSYSKGIRRKGGTANGANYANWRTDEEEMTKAKGSMTKENEGRRGGGANSVNEGGRTAAYGAKEPR
jgi:hypothetical protein